MEFLLGIAFLPWLIAALVVTEFLFVCFSSYTSAWVTLVLAITGLAWYAWHKDASFDYVEIARYSAYYIGLGLVWSVFKWILQMYQIKWQMAPSLEIFADNVNVQVNAYNALRSNSKIEVGIPFANVRNGAVDWAAYFPRVRENKARIGNWIMFWPLSFVATFVKDFVIRFVDNIVEMFKGIYDKLGHAILKSAFGLNK